MRLAHTIGFVGAGKMASAMIGGLLESRTAEPAQIRCTCGDDPTGPALAERTGIHFDARAADLAAASDILVLACKPQQFDQLDPALPASLGPGLVISILAGTRLSRIAERFPLARNSIRAMPNTPGQIGAGITAYASLKPLDPADQTAARAVLGALGTVLAVIEDELDAVTAVSGSGPAYVFEFTAALAEAGCNVGLAPETALELARQTVLGAARLMEATGEAPDTLRDNVTSPGGTTAAALQSFEADHFRAVVDRAVAAATARSRELGQ